MTETKVKAAVYLRISLDVEMDGLAINRQREDCMRIVREHGWTVYDEYVDQSISASDERKVRPAYNRMVEDYERGEFSIIVCWALDRLTRQPIQLEEWITRARRQGLAVHTVSGIANLSDEQGILAAGIMAQLARAEVMKMSARMKAKNQQRALQGGFSTGVRPMGYDRDGNVIEAEALIVKGVYKAFLDGNSIKSITRSLSGSEEEGLPNLPKTARPMHVLTLERNIVRERRGLPLLDLPDPYEWNEASILRILRNPRYAGYATYKPSDVAAGSPKWHGQILLNASGDPVMGQWEPIVDRDSWETVQRILDNPQRKKNRVGTDRKYMGSGLYRCETCGKKVKSFSKGQYRCAGHVSKSREHVDAIVLAVIRARLARPDLADLLSNVDTPRVKELDARISELRGQIKRLEEQFDNDEIEGRDMTRKRAKKEGEIDELEAERDRLMASSNACALLGSRDPVAAFDAADLGQKRAVINALCTVVLAKNPEDGARGFHPETVKFIWKG